MNALFASKLRQRVFQVLVDVLNYSPNVALYRGTVQFIGVAIWGKNQVAQQLDSFPMVLQAMLKVMTCGNELVIFEVMQNVKRMISKNGADLRLEWEYIIQILQKFKWSQFPSSISLKSVVQGTVQEIEGKIWRLWGFLPFCSNSILHYFFIFTDLYRKGKYYGDEDDFFTTMENYKDICEEATVFSTMQHRVRYILLIF